MIMSFSQRCENQTVIFQLLQMEYGSVMNMRMIHPLKQKTVYTMMNALKDELGIIKRIIIFGSSVSMKCSWYSDLDTAVEFIDGQDTLENKNRVSEIIGEVTEWNYDVVWLNGVDKTERLYQEIFERGKIIFDRQM